MLGTWVLSSPLRSQALYEKDEKLPIEGKKKMRKEGEKMRVPNAWDEDGFR